MRMLLCRYGWLVVMPPFEKAFLIEIIRSKVELPISPPNKLDLRFSALLRCSRN